MKVKSITYILFVLFFLSSCVVDGKMEGYILEIEEDDILLANDASLEEYEEWKELTYDELLEATPTPSLIEIVYEGEKEFQKGDRVQIQLDGDVLASFPGQAKAKKIKIIK